MSWISVEPKHEDMLSAQSEASKLPVTKDGDTVLPCQRTKQSKLIVEVIREKTSAGMTDAISRKHYVFPDPSIVTDQAKKHEYGDFIELYAKVAWEDADCTDSLAGHRIDWSFTTQFGNASTLPAPPKGLGRHAYKDAKFHSGLWGYYTDTTYDHTNDEGWVGPIYFYPSKCGGDVLTVWAKPQSNPGGGSSTGTYTIWRRIPFCQVFARSFRNKYNDRRLPIDRINQIYAPTFIEVADVEVENIFSKWFQYNVILYDTMRNYEVLTFTLDQPVFVDRNNFRRLHPLKFDGIYQPKYGRVGSELKPLVGADISIVPLSDAFDGLHGPAQEPTNPDNYIDDTLYSDELVIGPLLSDDTQRRKITDYRLRGRIRIDLSGLDLNPPPDADHPYTVQVVVDHAKHSSGDASGEVSSIAFGYLLESQTANVARELAAFVVSHEIGHKMNMYPPGCEYIDTSEFGRQGNHCRRDYCTMYWKARTGPKQGWCGRCVHFLRWTDVGYWLAGKLRGM